jgi:hypothetical protein
MPGTRLYALDLLGMGNSSRPYFQVRAKDPIAKIEEAEAFFIDALEEWRKEKKIEKMTLLVLSPLSYVADFIGSFARRLPQCELLYKISISCGQPYSRLACWSP